MEIKTVAAAELWSTSLTPVRDLHVILIDGKFWRKKTYDSVRLMK